MEIDLARNTLKSRGPFMGTVSIPGQTPKDFPDFPLVAIAVEGQSVSFQIAASAAGDNTFKGAFSPDGQSISGDLVHSGTSLSFHLSRTGEPRIEPPARSTAISRELEGTWTGALTADGKQLRAVLTMTNQADGTATGSMVSLDQGELEIPITTITQKPSSPTVDIKTIFGLYSGTLNEEGTALVGTWTEGSAVLPLTFRRAAASEGKK